MICLSLAAITVAAYWQVGSLGFVNLDDDAYVEFAPMVNKGLRAAGFIWAWTASHSTNWHPLTSLSHMLDCSLWGVRPGPMHWENVAWHVLNTLLVFGVWRAMSGAVWRSAIVAGLFALHPVHVESVAWISERKDVLCAFFWLLALALYVRWARRPSAMKYLAVLGATTASLLAKPMAVTLPVTLLLLDFWPLNRVRRGKWHGLVAEKLPLFVLVGIHSVITFLVQHGAGSADFGQRFTFGARLGNAIVAYARYLGKTFWPERLAPLYYHPGHWPAVSIAGALLLLATVSVITWWQRSRRPWFLFGWLWFLITLAPVIGLVQVGAQSMADRYTYIPLLGLFTAIMWAGAEVTRERAAVRYGINAATAALLGVLAIMTSHQVKAWQNSEQLYRHSIQVGEDNPAVRYLLAVTLQATKHPESELVAQFHRALELAPDYVNAHLQLAVIDLAHQRRDEAMRRIEHTIALEPQNPSLRFNHALLLLWQNKPQEARAELLEALKLNPNRTDARRQVAQLALTEGRFDEARAQYDEIVRRDRWNSPTFTEYGNLLANAGENTKAKQLLERATWIDPGNEGAQQSLAIVQQRLGATR